MKVAGFTIVRNAIRYDYPIVESILSALPVVDTMLVAVGQSDDGTRELVQAINSPKIIIQDTVWDDDVRTGGTVLAQQTDLAMKCCDGDWLLYLQADEVLHENDHANIRQSMLRYREHPTVEGLMFRYHHFRADYGIRDPLPYRKQVRIIRPGVGIRSHGDACGFRIDGRKLQTASANAWVYHYGYVKPPESMQRKMDYFLSLYDGRRVQPGEENDEIPYEWNLSTCEPFEGTHPQVMADRIQNKDWETPRVVLTSRWRNPKYWQGLIYKNTRTIRRWTNFEPGREKKAA